MWQIKITNLQNWSITIQTQKNVLIDCSAEGGDLEKPLKTQNFLKFEWNDNGSVSLFYINVVDATNKSWSIRLFSHFDEIVSTFFLISTKLFRLFSHFDEIVSTFLSFRRNCFDFSLISTKLFRLFSHFDEIVYKRCYL